MPFAPAAAAVGSIGSGVLGYLGSQNAAKAQENAASAASAAELQMFNKQQADLAPYQTAGTNALASLQQLLGIGANGSGGASSPILSLLGIGANGQPTGAGVSPGTFQTSPGYQFALQQGTNAVTNLAAANGGLGGNALRQLQSTGQGLANQTWQQYLSNVAGGYQGLVGNVQNLAGTGENAAAGAGQGALYTGGQIGSNDLAAGNAQSAGIIGGYNALAGGINGLIKNLTTGGLSGGGGGGGGGGNANSLIYALLNGGGSPISGQPSLYDGQMVNVSGWPGVSVASPS